MKRKDIIGEAAVSMRDAWEQYRFEISTTSVFPLSTDAWQQYAIRFVGKLMPDSNAGTILAVAKRLTEG